MSDPDRPVGWERWKIVATIGGVVLGVVVIALGITRPWDDGDDGSATETIHSVAPGVYVALGDSYSAGEGLPPFIDDTGEFEDGGDRCHRSNAAYPTHLTFEGMSERLFRACSGAVVADVYDRVQSHGDSDGADHPNHLGRQVEPGILGDDVALVTLTIGGNDVQFADALIFCAFHDDCMDDVYGGGEDGRTLATWVEDRLAKLQTDLHVLFPRLREDAPRARIVVLGYPALFPERSEGLTCAAAEGLFSRSEAAQFRGYGLELDRILQTEAAAANIEYVDTFTFFSSHEPCGPDDDWVRFVGPFRRYGWFHPKEIGQSKFARIVACYLDTHPAPNTSPAPSPSGSDEPPLPADDATVRCFNQGGPPPTPSLAPTSSP